MTRYGAWRLPYTIPRNDRLSRGFSSWVTFGCLVGVLGGGILGCGSDSTGPASGTLASQYWTLLLDHHAITLATVAPYDTLTLHATPQTFTGDTLPVVGSVVYTVANNDTTVRVSPTGVLQAHTTQSVTGAMVIATLTVGGAQGLTLVDTAWVNVTAKASVAAVPAVDSLSLQLADAGDSATIGFVRNTTLSLTPKVWSASQSLITDTAQVYYQVSRDQVVATLSSSGSNVGKLTELSPGHLTIYATATIYGTPVTDSLRVTIGYPTLTVLTVDTSLATGVPTVAGFPRDTIFIGVGGVAVWYNGLYGKGVSHDSVDVEFTDPTNVTALNSTITALTVTISTVPLILVTVKTQPDGGGNIAPFTPYARPAPTGKLQYLTDLVGSHGRTFPVAGVYRYHSRFFPGEGTIVVIPNASLP